MSLLLPFKFPASRKYNTILNSCATTTITMHVRAGKALFYVIMHKVYRTPFERLGSIGFDWLLVRFHSIDYAGSRYLAVTLTCCLQLLGAGLKYFKQSKTCTLQTYSVQNIWQTMKTKWSNHVTCILYLIPGTLLSQCFAELQWADLSGLQQEMGFPQQAL